MGCLIPSGGRNINNPQQYHNTNRMRNSSRSTKRTSTPRTNGRRRNQSSNLPRVSGTDSHDSRKSVRKIKNGTLQFAQRQLRHIFPGKPADMTAVPRSIAEHRLNIREGCQPIRQKRREQAPDRNKAIQEEVELVEAEIIREVHYHDWLSNPVMNAGAPYQRLVDKAFKKQIGENLEVYVDDLVIKSHTEHEILWDIEETFRNLRRINMKLNPKNACSARKREHSWATWTRMSIRGQILADFITKRPDGEDPLMKTPAEEAEYEALIASMRIAEQIGVKNLVAKVDSRLVENQINESYKAKEQSMIQYLGKAKALTDNFKMFLIEKVSQSKNKKADALSKIASTSFVHLTKQVLVEILKNKSIEEQEILAVVKEEGHCWMTPLIEYLTEGTLPADTKKAPAVKIKARQYIMINDILYRKSFLEPWLQCVGPTQAVYVVKEIHEGSCSMHSDPRSVVAKVIRSGYYGPTMHKDA
uniref:Reverse transcriptase domain-containing protein n=1 Tax=Tanacetum cinerariifolium TaxID=118510 RepID=A0A6L2LCG5_TANCI|nr:reverse transcriptase domain-containing protein [Tanacetum cinerariifolium]